MITGTSSLLVKISASGEAGIYRINEDGLTYLVFPFDDSDEAIEKGKAIAKILSISCRIDLSKSIKPSAKALKKAEKKENEKEKESKREERKSKKEEKLSNKEKRAAEKKAKRILREMQRIEKTIAKLEA